ncbi:unnamed protein product, partial [Iphiclides podalirius]
MSRGCSPAGTSTWREKGHGNGDGPRRTDKAALRALSGAAPWRQRGTGPGGSAHTPIALTGPGSLLATTRHQVRTARP